MIWTESISVHPQCGRCSLTLPSILARICVCNLCSDLPRCTDGLLGERLLGNLLVSLACKFSARECYLGLGQCPSYHVPYAGMENPSICSRTREHVIVLAIGACRVSGESLNSRLTHYVRSASSAASSSPHLCPNIFKKLVD
jgi:hypothetical protein